eukprot:TRINITY_DN1129_c0_g1_i6.p1 TRINITY_DN1129_c0_g1~~TRINITY_DN1129_c0_g1_i6.p1  ORF type:complete len:339 (-),score=64.43 TRINITY_DN1129_c0_g1_i6:167-1183(-)
MSTTMGVTEENLNNIELGSPFFDGNWINNFVDTEDATVGSENTDPNQTPVMSTTMGVIEENLNNIELGSPFFDGVETEDATVGLENTDPNQTPVNVPNGKEELTEAQVVDDLPTVYLWLKDNKRNHYKSPMCIPHSQQMYISIDVNEETWANTIYTRGVLTDGGTWIMSHSNKDVKKQQKLGDLIIDNKSFCNGNQEKGTFRFVFFANGTPIFKSGILCLDAKQMLCSFNTIGSQHTRDLKMYSIEDKIKIIIREGLINQSPLSPEDMEFLKDNTMKLASIFLDPEFKKQLPTINLQFYELLELIAMGAQYIQRSRSHADFLDTPETPSKRRRDLPQQ